MPRAAKNFECLHEDCQKGLAKDRIFSTKQGITAHFFRKHQAKLEEKDFRMTNKLPKKRQYIRTDERKEENKKRGEVKTTRQYKKRVNPITLKTMSGILKIPITLEIDFDFGSVRIGEESTNKVGVK